MSFFFFFFFFLLLFFFFVMLGGEKERTKTNDTVKQQHATLPTLVSAVDGG